MNKIVLLAAALLAVAIVTPPVEAGMTKPQIKQSLEKAYPVRVLDKYIESGTFDGRPVFHVKVMNRGGNFNAALMITTLVVDADSGELLSVFRHKDSGYELSDGGDREANRQPVDAPRGVQWR